MMGHYLGQFDNYKYAIVVDSGKKEDKTDVHSVNQRSANLDTRDQAKTMIYATIYGAGSTRVGQMICSNISKVKFTKQNFINEKENLKYKTIIINDKVYYPIDKDTLVPFDDVLIIKSIYGKQTQQKFKDNTLGYNQCLEYLTDLADKDSLYGLDGRKLYSRASHKAFNLVLQSAGAIFMKYYLIFVDFNCRKYWTHGKEFGYVANIHDGINIEIVPEIQESIAEILITSFKATSDFLGLKYPVKGNPHFGLNQWEVH